MKKEKNLDMSPEQVENLRKKIKKGMVLELDHMDDFHAPKDGTRGVVSSIDDAGYIHMHWTNGSGVPIAPLEDLFHIVTNDDIEIVKVKDRGELYELYDAFTIAFVGVEATKQKAKEFFAFAEENSATPVLRKRVFVVDGKLMNEFGELTSCNAYPDDMKIFVFKDEDLSLDYSPPCLDAMHALGGKDLGDILDGKRQSQYWINGNGISYPLDEKDTEILSDEDYQEDIEKYGDQGGIRVF